MMVKRNPVKAADAPTLKDEAELGGGGGAKAEFGDPGCAKTSMENFIPTLQWFPIVQTK